MEEEQDESLTNEEVNDVGRPIAFIASASSSSSSSLSSKSIVRHSLLLPESWLKIGITSFFANFQFFHFVGDLFETWFRRFFSHTWLQQMNVAKRTSAMASRSMHRGSIYLRRTRERQNFAWCLSGLFSWTEILAITPAPLRTIFFARWFLFESEK